jgi:CheY-like chemotaxis protein
VNTQTRNILLVEDDKHDAFFLKRALQKVRPDLPLQVVTDGEQALDYLNGRKQYSDRATYPLPSNMFLDLKLPYFSGFEILEHIKGNPSLIAIAVFVLTSSPEERDRERALELGARQYLVKPPTPEMLLNVLGPPSAGQSRPATSDS